MSTSLDCRPLPAPVSPFSWMAAMLRADRYANEQLASEAGQIARWLEYLAARLPGIQTADPLLLATVARMAADAPTRKLLREALAAIDAELVKVEPRNGHAAPVNGHAGGYAIK